MKTVAGISLVALVICLWTPADVSARGPRGGGGGGGGGMSRGGGGMSRPSPSISRSPSVSRSAPSMGRPSSPSINRPSGPSIGRPSSPSINRPSSPSIGRPSAPGTGRPGGGGPIGGGGAIGAGNRPIGDRTPSRGDLQDFLDLPGPSGAGSGRPSTWPSGDRASLGGAVAGGVAGGAAAEFLQNRDGAASQLPAGVGDRIGERPGAGDGPLADRLPAERPAASDRVGDRGDRVGDRDDRVDNRGDRTDNRGDRTDNRGDRTDNRGDRTDNRSDRIDNRAGRIDNKQQWLDNRVDRRDEVWDQVQENYPRLDFWTDHPAWGRWAVTRPYRWATWGAVTGWFAFDWTQPTYYYYGDNVYYEGDTVYYGDQVVATSAQYAQQAEQIVDSAPEAVPDQTQWMPLGVFAMTQDGEPSGPEPTLFLQLVVSKEGILGGTYSNTATGTTLEVQGMVDKKTQRVAWTMAGQEWPIMETGIYNLTQDTAPALLHFDGGRTQQWLLVRLKDPDAPQDG